MKKAHLMKSDITTLNNGLPDLRKEFKVFDFYLGIEKLKSCITTENELNKLNELVDKIQCSFVSKHNHVGIYFLPVSIHGYNNENKIIKACVVDISNFKNYSTHNSFAIRVIYIHLVENANAFNIEEIAFFCPDVEFNDYFLKCTLIGFDLE